MKQDGARVMMMLVHSAGVVVLLADRRVLRRLLAETPAVIRQSS